VINQQRNGLAMPRRRHLFIPVCEFLSDALGICRPILLLVKIDEQEHLVLYRGEQVVLFDEIKYFWPAQTEEVG
jgi:hypothetical protein